MDCTFLSDPDDSLKCCICYEIAKDPKQEEACGKLFCDVCIDLWEENSCPACRATNPRYFIDRKSYREIQALAVLCDNEDDGCDWKGTVATLENHEAECGYAEVPCPNSCMESGFLFRKNLRYHLIHNCPEREYTCPHCGKESTYKDVTEVHDVVCEKKIVDCSNEGCSMRMERGQVESHVRESCDYTEVYCKYASIGCEEKNLRKTIKQHEEDSEYHLAMSLKKIVELSKVVLKDSTKDKTNSVTFQLTGYSEKKKSDCKYFFQPFFTSPSGYKMSFFLYPNGNGTGKGTHLSLYLQILCGPYDGKLALPLNAEFTIQLLNQLADRDHCNQTLKFEGDHDHCRPGGVGWGYHEFFELSKLSHNVENNTEYLKDDVLYFRVTSDVSSHKPWLDHTHNVK